MISMNIRPPREIAERKLERTPKVKARILNSCIRNIGAFDRSSTDHEEREQGRPGGEAPYDGRETSSPSGGSRTAGSRT